MSADKNNQSKDVYSSQLDIETKRFFFDLKENHKGQYLRITEVSGGRSSIVIPVDGLEDFSSQIEGIIDKANGSS
ncbi:MAG: DNA-binding protein [Thermodesulfobacteriota bacterium]|mgnify:CR=1 FL=1|nr:DNA-binding protein [Thermodesulfobacteriota bacterium]MEE2975537.1 DNA-binding protein [Thermodesulfobacteriota bacterium]|tara:strand:- start:505 stop:729 length:225 start_codon:yes stop_codon:yes gene_type:complete